MAPGEVAAYPGKVDAEAEKNRVKSENITAYLGKVTNSEKVGGNREK